MAFLGAASLDSELDLVVAGPDEKNWRKALEAVVSAADLSSRLHWTGVLTGNEKWGAFFCSEVFLLPSQQENSGIAVTEALACGKAVLPSDKVNIAPDIAAAGAGLVDSDTEAGTLRLISAWIAMSSKRRHSLELRALQLFETRYDMRRDARDLGVLLREAGQSDLACMTSPASAVR